MFFHNASKNYACLFGFILNSMQNRIYCDKIRLMVLSMPIKLPFFTLLLLISFASVNAVLFTPALPDIAYFFNISADQAEHIISWFLIGYALGQLFYGPIANRLGRKPTLYIGIGLQIISSLFCVLAGFLHMYSLLVAARFFCALGSGVGIMMTFTLVNECHEPKIANQKISYLILAFAVTPGLSVTCGGLLNTYFGWTSCFYAGALYGLILFILATRLPETLVTKDHKALKIKRLLTAYGHQFQNTSLVVGGLLMGLSGCFIYIFAALGPFIAITLYHMTSAEYGSAYLLPSIGLILGSLASAKLATQYPILTLIRTGIGISIVGVALMFITIMLHCSGALSLFIPVIIIYFGLCFLLTNGSAYAMSKVSDKANGSAIMSFINLSTVTISVLLLSLFPITAWLLFEIYLILCLLMVGTLLYMHQYRSPSNM